MLFQGPGLEGHMDKPVVKSSSRYGPRIGTWVQESGRGFVSQGGILERLDILGSPKRYQPVHWLGEGFVYWIFKDGDSLILLASAGLKELQIWAEFLFD